MASLTTRLKLRKPASTDLIDVTADIANNYDLLDKNPGIFAYTNAQRLALLTADVFVGMRVWESDTDAEFLCTATTPTWRALIPACRVYNTTSPSIANTTNTKVPAFDTERYDNDNMHSTVTNTGRITFNTPGLYRIGASIDFVPNATGARICQIILNNVTTICSATGLGVSGGAGTGFCLNTEYRVVATDYVEVSVWQNSGGALSLSNSVAFSPEFWASRISA